MKHGHFNERKENHGIASYITKIEDIPQLDEKEKAVLADVTRKYAFRISEYYLNLINWEDPNDPIRRIIIPVMGELIEWGELDASNEDYYTVLPGLEHKYQDTVLLLLTDICAGFCRFCFRKRLFIAENDEARIDISESLQYITDHEEVNNVLLSGGDPLLLSTRRLKHIIVNLLDIDHVRIIRVGTKTPAFNPGRILNDSALRDLFESVQENDKQLYLMVHFNHPRELSESAINSIQMIRKTGTVVLNQTPIINGVNDNPIILRELFETLSFAGVNPYYVFQCRPTMGNIFYSFPVEEAYQIFEVACRKGSGLSKSARFVMSHYTGKVEVVGLDKKYIYFKYLRAANLKNAGKIVIYERNPEAYWLENYLSQNTFRAEQLTTERINY